MCCGNEPWVCVLKGFLCALCSHHWQRAGDRGTGRTACSASCCYSALLFPPRTQSLRMTMLLKTTASPWIPRTEENTLISRLPTSRSLNSDSGKKSGIRPCKEMDPDLSSWISQTSLTCQKQISMGRIPIFRYKFMLMYDFFMSCTKFFYWTKITFSLASMTCSQNTLSLYQ